MNDQLDDEAAYLLRRAQEEERQAATAEQPKAAAVHRSLAHRYATRALLAQVDAVDDAPPPKVRR